jgi:hypothetical protein
MTAKNEFYRTLCRPSTLLESKFFGIAARAAIVAWNQFPSRLIARTSREREGRRHQAYVRGRDKSNEILPAAILSSIPNE